MEVISNKEPGDDRKFEIDQVHSKLEELEAYEEGEDTARILRGTSLKDGPDNSRELKKKISEQPFQPSKNVNFDNLITNDCNMVLQEIQSGTQMGANRHTSIPVVGLPPNAKNGGMDFHHQANPGGALGKLINDYKESSQIGSQVSQQTQDLMRNTLRMAGVSNLESMLTQTTGKPLNSFFTSKG